MFRYPGNKSKFAKQIEPYITERYDGSLTVPFIGAGGVTLNFLKKFSPQDLWLNDIDPGVATIWKAIYHYPRKFLHKLDKYTPTSHDFYDLKMRLSDGEIPSGVEDITDIALAKIILHQISYCGLGIMASYPVGGSPDYYSAPKYKWRVSRLKKHIEGATRLLHKSKNVRITCEDFREVLGDERSRGMCYLDPPDMECGDIYKFNFTYQDHWRLSEFLYKRHDWVLSYNSTEMVRNFYSWANISTITVRVGSGKKTKEDLVICDY